MIFSQYSTAFDDAPKCIDLFCGAGGLTLGFTQAGGVPVAALDSDHDSIETYKKMFSLCRDVQCVKIEEWKLKEPISNVDVVIGGPPCQGFSTAGHRFIDDPRNKLYKYFVKAVEETQPKWIVMENVPGIITIGGGSVLKQIYEDFDAIGYKLTHRVINMADYGVPQTRRRTIFVGNREGKAFVWPESAYVKMPKDVAMWMEWNYRTVNMAVNDLPWPSGNYFSHRANSKMRGPRNRDVLTQPAFTLRVRGDEFAFCELPATGAFPPGECPEMEMFYYPIENEYQETMREDPPIWVEDYEKPKTIEKVKDFPLKGTRRLAVREQARLQSFPDWFEFSGSPYSQGRQIGNAVPPLFARQLFASLIKQL